MIEFIGGILVGLVCIGLGIANMRGHIGSLHSYHRHRVSEEDRLPFGRRVGLGTILCGVGIVAMSVFSILALRTENQVYQTVGGIVLGVFLVVGLGITFAAMRKYNKGIF